MSQKDDAIAVFHVAMFQGWLLRHEELVSILSSTVNFLRKATIEGPIALHADITMGVKNVLFPASLSSLRTTLWLRFTSSRARNYALTPTMPACAPLP